MSCSRALVTVFLSGNTCFTNITRSYKSNVVDRGKWAVLPTLNDNINHHSRQNAPKQASVQLHESVFFSQKLVQSSFSGSQKPFSAAIQKRSSDPQICSRAKWIQKHQRTLLFCGVITSRLRVLWLGRVSLTGQSG